VVQQLDPGADLVRRAERDLRAAVVYGPVQEDLEGGTQGRGAGAGPACSEHLKRCAGHGSGGLVAHGEPEGIWS